MSHKLGRLSCLGAELQGVGARRPSTRCGAGVWRQQVRNEQRPYIPHGVTISLWSPHLLGPGDLLCGSLRFLRLVPNRKRSTSRLYIVTRLI